MRVLGWAKSISATTLLLPLALAVLGCVAIYLLLIFRLAPSPIHYIGVATNSVPDGEAKPPLTLAEARAHFTTKLIEQLKSNSPLGVPPPGVFDIVKYDSVVGPLSAYLTCDPHDGKKHPAIVWITGGDCNSIGDVWSREPWDNDQSASQYREAGIVMMYPSLRGGNENPGFHEDFYGEVNDVISAADFLSKQPWVDASRIYLGGHSTGGTLVLLVSEFSGRFRAVFCFGPVETPLNYDPQFLPNVFDQTNKLEVALRSPYRWLESIKSPTFVFEGAEHPSNAVSVNYMAGLEASPQVHFYVLPGLTHFSILAPANCHIADKILRDNGATSNIQFTKADLDEISLKEP